MGKFFLVTTSGKKTQWFRQGHAPIYFNWGLNPARIQEQPLLEYWLHTITNVIIIIYPLTLFKDRPLFKYQPSFKSLQKEGLIFKKGRNL